MNSIVRGATVACLLVVLSVPAHAQVLRQLTDGTSGSDPLWALDDTGYVLFMDIEADPFGTNPEQSLQLYRIAFPGSIVSQVGSFSQGLAGGSVSCTDDGGQALVISPSDPLGMNHDRSLELFLVEADGTGMVQLTSDPAPNAGSVLEARIAGSGSVAAFLADIDPFGTNPDHAVQLFVVDTATLAVTQVTTATTGEFRGFSISDDGDRVVFAHHGDPIPGSVTGGTPELFTFVVSISLRKQATVASSVRNPVISGNGEKIAFNDSGEVVVRDWFGTTTVVIGPGWAPTITDDGEWVYFEAEDFAEIVQIWVADTGGAGPPVDITQTTDPWGNYGPIVSGNNTRIAFVTSGGEIGDGLVVMDVDGTNVDDVILPSWEERPGGSWPVITADGSLILYYPGGLWSMRPDGSELFEILPYSAGGYNVSASADGGTIVFESWADITGQNPDTDRQVFKVHSDGTGLVQVSPGDCETLHPTVSADAGVVTTFSTCDWTGENPGIDPEVFAVSLDGGAHVQITYNDSFEWRFPRISENGEWVTYEGSGQIQRARTDGSVVEQITFHTDGGSYRPDISADGSRVAYTSTADPVGTNPDHNREVFVFDASTSTSRQMTVTTGGSSWDPVISGDGEHVYFMSDARFFETVPTALMEYYRATVETGVVERVGGLRDPRSRLDNVHTWYFPVLTVSHSGDLVAYSGPLNPTGENNDLGYDIWLVDFTTLATIRPSKATPTVVTWDVEPTPVRYDVIRGDVADLQWAPGGVAVDLGPVVCLEDDSPDATTLGFEDPDEPSPGQAFFFLYRGSQGINDGPGSWGRGTGDAERIAGAGSCFP